MRLFIMNKHRKMKKIEFRRLALVAALAVLAAQATAQEESRPQERRWTLGECIEYARSNNIQVRKAQIKRLGGRGGARSRQGVALPHAVVQLGTERVAPERD